MTLSALVQNATLPGDVKVWSVAVEQLLAIERHGEPVAPGMQDQLVPPIGCDRKVGTGELLTLAAHHLVEAHVSLQGIRARHVVVVRVEKANRQIPRPDRSFPRPAEASP